MNNDEFTKKTEGLPWSDRSCSFETCDCWGLVVLYYRHVFGVEIHHTKDYESGNDFITCFDNEVLFWRKKDKPTNDGIFVSFIGKRPVHVGLIINGMAYHSRAEKSHVRFDRIRTLEKIFTKVDYYAIN